MINKVITVAMKIVPGLQTGYSSGILNGTPKGVYNA